MCQHLTFNLLLELLPVGVKYANGVYDVLVEWKAGHFLNQTCEVNYHVQWRTRGQTEFSPEYSILIQDELETIVKVTVCLCVL